MRRDVHDLNAKEVNILTEGNAHMLRDCELRLCDAMCKARENPMANILCQTNGLRHPCFTPRATRLPETTVNDLLTSK